MIQYQISKPFATVVDNTVMYSVVIRAPFGQWFDMCQVKTVTAFSERAAVAEAKAWCAKER